MRIFFQMIFAILTLAALIWAGWQGYLLLRKEQLGLDSSTQSLIIIISILVIICTFILTSAIRTAAEIISRGRQYQNKVLLYENLLLVWQALQTDNTNEEKNKLERDLNTLRAGISLQTSSKVLKATNELFSLAQSQGFNAPSVEEARDNLLLAMRADLGNTNDFYLKKELKKLFTT